MKNNLIWVVLLFIVAIGSFFAGTKYQASKMPVFNRANFVGRNPQVGANMIRGEITALDDNSITIKQPDGSSKIVFLSDSTIINKSQTGSITDLTAGLQVSVFGQSGSDSTVTAQNIQLGGVNPANPIGQ